MSEATVPSEVELEGYGVLLKPLRFPFIGVYDRFFPGVGIVLKLGKEAFDKKAFPDGPKCSEGDMVHFGGFPEEMVINNSLCAISDDIYIESVIENKDVKNYFLERYGVDFKVTP